MHKISNPMEQRIHFANVLHSGAVFVCIQIVYTQEFLQGIGLSPAA